MTFAVVLLLFVTFAPLIYSSGNYRAVKAVTLTPNNTNESGANINVLSSDVTTTTHQWNIVTTNQIGFQLRISLDSTWGFIDDEVSELRILFNNNNTDRTLSRGQLLTSFSVDNSQYLTTLVNPIRSSVFPNCHNNPIHGDVASKVNNVSRANESRIQKATYGTLYDWPIYLNAMEDYNTSWPLLFRIVNYGELVGDHMILDLFNEGWPTHLHCRYESLFPSNRGLDIYIAAADNGDALNITEIHLQYFYDLTYAPTNQPTTASPTATSMNPTTTATGNPTAATTTTPITTITTTNLTNTDTTASMDRTTTFFTTTHAITTSISSAGCPYGVNISFTFQYEVENDTVTFRFNANITKLIAANINDVMEDKVMDICEDGSYTIRVDENSSSTIRVDASIFVDDQTAQDRLYAFVSDENQLKGDVITSINEDHTNKITIVAPNNFKVLSVDKIIRETDMMQSTALVENQTISTTQVSIEYTKKNDTHNDLILQIVVMIVCVAVVLILIDMIYIHRMDRYHATHILVFALAICNLLTDVAVSYRMCVYYVYVNHGLLVLMVTICASVFLVAPYLYHIMFGTGVLYDIPSHLCCLFSNLLLVTSGDMCATINVLSVFDLQSAAGISIDIQNKAKIAIILCHLSQIIIQAMFMMHWLQYVDALIIASIVLSFVTLIPYCVYKKKEKAPVTKHNGFKIETRRTRSTVTIREDTFTTVNTPTVPSKPHDGTDTDNADADEETDEDMYLGKRRSTVRTRDSETVAYTAIKFEDLDVEHNLPQLPKPHSSIYPQLPEEHESIYPQLPEEHISIYGTDNEMQNEAPGYGNVNGIMVTNRGAESAEIELEGQPQETSDPDAATKNEGHGDKVKESVLLDAILSEVLEKQELDPNKIHEMNANEVEHYNNNSISNDSDKIYDRSPLKKHNK